MYTVLSPHRPRARRPGLGEVDPWTIMSGHLWSPSEVYVLRLVVVGAPIEDTADALVFVKAAGQDQNLRLDVRGLAVSPVGGGARQQVDVICTVREGGLAIPFVSDDAASIAAQIAADPDVRRAWPGISVVSAVFGRLTAPPAALDHWQAQSLLWSTAFPGERGRGGPTDAFAMPAPLALVKGKAEDGKTATPLPPRTPSFNPSGESPWPWIGLGVVVLAGGIMYSRQRRSKS